MNKLKVFFTDKYRVPLPEGHRFPMIKYRLTREYLLANNILSESELYEPDIATENEILLCHSEDYYESFRTGSIDEKAIRKLGLPWSYDLFLRSLASVGGSLSSAKSALESGIAGNLSGGTHHAFREHGEGYCVFNDFAIVSTYLQKNNLAKRIAIVDLDVHQGNGTSSILKENKNVFILDMHGEKNYPYEKIPSTLDVRLPDNTNDERYLSVLENKLEVVYDFEPDIVLFLAGVDPLKEDALGRLALTKEGLRERDYMVLNECKKRNIPISIALGGGYAKPIELTVECYAQTYEVVKEVFSF
ncbi:MAG: histone deacetylase [Ignavibacteria bacterium]|nr:histone deacetylase [Ignavibacteria bacterium]